MTKRFLIFILALGLTGHLVGCTSGGSKDDGQVAESEDQSFSQEGEGDFADEGGETNPQDQIAQEGGVEGGADTAENPPQDTGQDLALDGQDKAAGGAGDELSLEDPQPLPEEIASGTPPQQQDPKAQEPMAQGQPDLLAPPSEAGNQAQNSASGAPPTDEPLFKPEEAKPADLAPPAETVAAAPEAPKVFAPLLKIKDSAFKSGGANLNRVYVGRPGDTTKSVSQKIYGKDRSKDLKSWNAFLKNRGVKTGDKIYYQSPKDPGDSQMLTYYEEQGIPPMVYTSKEGDNIRKLSKQLLGSGESWKEVWSTNRDVDSKGDIPAGLEIKYWPEGSAVAKNAAPSEEAVPPMDDLAVAPPTPPLEPPPDLNPPPPPPTAMNDHMPAPPPPPPQASAPLPASTPDSAAGAAGTLTPPPDEAPPPPPPPPPEPKPIAKKTAPKGDLSSANDPDTMLAMGLGGIILLATAVLFVILRKNKAKRVDLGHTQV